MGDVLSDDFPMTTFPRIVAAYKSIFRDDAVASIIRDQGIRSLSAVRNVLVHKAGKADRDFERQVKADPRFAGVRAHQSVELKGPITAELVEATAGTQGYKFIQSLMRGATPN